jgi:hypothetical protein
MFDQNLVKTASFTKPEGVLLFSRRSYGDKLKVSYSCVQSSIYGERFFYVFMYIFRHFWLFYTFFRIIQYNKDAHIMHAHSPL